MFGQVTLCEHACSVVQHINDHATAITKGDRAHSVNTGLSSTSISLGLQSSAIVEGDNSISVALGVRSMAQAATGSWIVLVERDDFGTIVDIKAAQAGEEIEPDVLYVLKGGVLRPAVANQNRKALL